MFTLGTVKENPHERITPPDGAAPGCPAYRRHGRRGKAATGGWAMRRAAKPRRWLESGLRAL